MMREIKDRIKAHEGFRDTIYKDSLGKATIGWGHLILENDKYEEGVAYSVEDLEDTFENDFQIAFNGSQTLIQANLGSKEYNDLPERNKNIIEGVITEMVFQLGIHGVSKFKKMWLYLDECNFKMASIEMKDSLWYEQTRARCIELSTIIGSIK